VRSLPLGLAEKPPARPGAGVYERADGPLVGYLNRALPKGSSPGWPISRPGLARTHFSSINAVSMTLRAKAIAHPNIALIKYWGNQDDGLRLASNSSLSMNLAGLETRTSVQFVEGAEGDELTLDEVRREGETLQRVSAVLDLVRERAGLRQRAIVQSVSNFPQGVGIASSASGFAALALAACAAAGLNPSESELSRLARRGSGSACRSVPGGFVVWEAASQDEASTAHSIAPPEHWALIDLIAVVSREHKTVGSTTGHRLAPTSPLQAARVADAPRRLAECKAALLARDFESLAAVVEQDSDLLHAVMMTSMPSLHYWRPATVEVMRAVRGWRAAGLSVCYTVDAGPNVHILCAPGAASEAHSELRKLAGVLEVLEALPGGPARLIG